MPAATTLRFHPADLPRRVALSTGKPDEPVRRYILRATRAGKLLLTRDDLPAERPPAEQRPR